MKTPPFLIFAALLFWGWQSDLLLIGAVMGIVLEAVRFTRYRWELDDPDFSRIWFFCLMLTVVLAAYVFTTNGEGNGLSGLIHGNLASNGDSSGDQRSTRFLRWLPMTYFALITAQVFNLRPTVPVTGISPVLRWRQRKGDRAFAGKYVDISYSYFIVCLFSAGIHNNPGTQTYFWGLCVLIAWALWTLRSRRFGALTWLGAFATVIGLGVLGSFGVSQAQRAIQNFNSQWMAEFFTPRTAALQSMTSMGQIGRLKLSPKIVIWLQPHELGELPEYLREASYRNYQALKETWYGGGLLNDFELLHSEPDNTSWVLLPGKKTITTINIACYLNGWSRELGAPEGLIPLPSGCGQLDNVPANMVLKKNQNGAVLAAGRGLLIFDARYGPGATIDAPPETESTDEVEQTDLGVPTNEIPALRKVIAEMHLPRNAGFEQTLQSVGKFFLDNFTYSIWQGPDKLATTNATPLTKFLLTSRSGHCEYFATATVLLLRQLGIPARYAVGYYVHEPRGSGYIVRQRDAHAWCLVWDQATKTWEDFDTTPPSWVAIESKRTGFDWFSDALSWIGFQIAKFRSQQTHPQRYIFWSLIPVMAVLLYHIIFRRRRRRKNTGATGKKTGSIDWPGLDSEFYQLESRLAARGVPRQTGEPLADWLERALAEPSVANLRLPVRQLLHLHYRYRFDPQGLDGEERKALAEKVESALTELSDK